MMKQLLFLAGLVISSVSMAQSETTKVFGDYDVHYSVLNSTFITPQVAQAYGIVRGKDRALINIAVRKRLARGETQAKKSMVSGSSSDLIHSSKLEFTEIVEQDSIYYIAELRFNNKELRTFTISIQPDANIAPYTLKFNKTLYFN